MTRANWQRSAVDADAPPDRRPEQMRWTPQAVASAIEQDVIRRGWPVGSIYATQPELEERFGVSRMVLREATRILEQHKVVVPRQGRGGGLVIAAPDHEAVTRSVSLLLSYERLSVDELRDVRIPLDITAARLAAERVDDAAVRRISDVIAAETADPMGVGAALNAPNLHVILAELSGNRALALFCRVLTEVGRQGAESAVNDRAAGVRLMKQHAAVAEAVIAGDADLAAARMREHVLSLRELGV
jgi:DNA-binding FadR family transcriptional regulator